MTTVEILFRYAHHPTESVMLALGSLHEVYGIRRIELKEAGQTIRVEYDATRFTAPTVEGLLRRTGLVLAEELPLIPPQPAPAATPEAAPAK